MRRLGAVGREWNPPSSKGVRRIRLLVCLAFLFLFLVVPLPGQPSEQ